MEVPGSPSAALVNISDKLVLDYCNGLADVACCTSHQVKLNRPLTSQEPVMTQTQGIGLW